MIEKLTSWQKSIYKIIEEIDLNHKSYITFDDDYVIEFDDYISNVIVTMWVAIGAYAIQKMLRRSAPHPVPAAVVAQQ